MALSIWSRVKQGWNAFRDNSPDRLYSDYASTSYSYRPDRMHYTRGNESSIVTALYNRIGIDGSAIDIRHVLLDENGRYSEVVNSGLNNCFSLEANKDQTGRAFVQDILASMCDEGCVALVPVDTDDAPDIEMEYDILSMRTGKILEWHPDHVTVRVYNDKIGRQEDLTLKKSTVAIIENPLYAVMNEPNSTLQRLKRKLNLLDVIDEQSGSGKLDLIIQLPYTIRTPTRKQQADDRRDEIERQLSGSKYGIAYTDGTEKITQLNRPAENNLLAQVEYLTSMLYSQLGITQSILDGTADETTMLNYYNRTIGPMLDAIVDEIKRKFLSPTARQNGQSILYFRDPFKLVPVEQIASIADSFTRNEILSSNEIRQVIGRKPSNDPRADQLVNKNLSAPKEDAPKETSEEVENTITEKEESQDE